MRLPATSAFKIWFRHLRPGELDHEAIWLAVSVCTALGAAAWLWLDRATPGCLWHAATGFPCPSCGGTRCFRHLLEGDLTRAALANPLVFAGIGAVFLFDLYAAAALAFRLPRFRPNPGPAMRHLIRWSVVGTIAANWVYLIATR